MASDPRSNPTDHDLPQGTSAPDAASAPTSGVADERPPHAADILAGITDAFMALDAGWRFTHVNDQAARLLARAREDLLGRNVWDEFPEAVGTAPDREYRRAVEERVAVSFEQFYPPLSAWFQVRAYPFSGGLSVFFQDITEQAKRRRYEQFLADLAERARALTDPDDVIADAVNSVGRFLGVGRCVFGDIDLAADTCTIVADYCADGAVASIVGVFPFSAFGPFVVAEYAAGRAVAVDDVRLDPVRVTEANVGPYEAMGIRAHVTAPVVHSARLVSVLAVHNPAPRRWKAEEVELVQAVVERTWLTVEVLRQQRALAREAEATARILESITDAFFTLDDEYRFAHVNRETERVLFKSRAQLLGRYIWEVFPEGAGSTFDRQYRRAVAEGVAVSFEEFYPPLGIWFDVRAYPSAGGLSVFFQDVSGRKRAEAEREWLLAEQRTRAEREALLNRIGQALRASSDPEQVLEAAVRELGEALGADRCSFALSDLGRGVVSIARDWRRADLPSVQGVYPFPNTAEMFRELYHGAATSVIADAHTAPLSARTRANMESLGLRSRISVALADGDGLMATLTAATTDQPREWTGEAVSLVEAVGTQLRTAVEVARLHHAAEEAAAREREMRVYQRVFLRDVLASVTEGHLLLCDRPEDLPPPLTPVGEPVVLARGGGLRELRHLALDAAEGMTEERRHDLVTAVSEAAMNAVTHGGGLGTGWVSVGADGTVQVRVEDQGTGIALESLPKATLARGYSTKASLGHGFKMMQQVDRVSVLTGPGGTTVVLEQGRQAAPPPWL